MRNKIDSEIAKLYVLVLKHGMKISDIPRAWLNFEMAKASMNVGYRIGKIPKFIKMLMKYDTTKKG